MPPPSGASDDQDALTRVSSRVRKWGPSWLSDPPPTPILEPAPAVLEPGQPVAPWPPRPTELSQWPVPWRQRWADRAENYQCAGLDWKEAEQKAWNETLAEHIEHQGQLPVSTDHEPDTPARIWGDWLRSLAEGGHVARLLGEYAAGRARRLLGQAAPRAVDVEAMRENVLAVEAKRWPERYEAAGLPMPSRDPLIEALEQIERESRLRLV